MLVILMPTLNGYYGEQDMTVKQQKQVCACVCVGGVTVGRLTVQCTCEDCIQVLI